LGEHVLAFPSITAFPLLGIGMGVISVFFGVMLIFAAPKPNPVGGVRTPWTYADEAIWYESHRAFGWGMIASGVVWPIYWPAGLVMTIAVGIGSLPFSWARYAAKYGTARTWNTGQGWRGYRPVARCRGCHHLTKLNSPEELALAKCEQCGQALAQGHSPS
jgi:hypothetical protein